MFHPYFAKKRCCWLVLPPFRNLVDQRVSMGGRQQQRLFAVSCNFRSHHEDLAACQQEPAVHYQTDWKPTSTLWLPTGETNRDKERDRERKDAFSLLIKIFFHVWQGMEGMVAKTVLGTCFVVVLFWDYSNCWLQKIGCKVPTIDFIWRFCSCHSQGSLMRT